MKKKEIKLGIILFILGFIGILSLLDSNLLDNLPEEAIEQIKDLPEIMIKLSLLISPTILLLIAVIVGLLTFKKTQLSIPVIENLLSNNFLKQVLKDQIMYGIIGGILAGSLIVITSISFQSFLPSEFTEMEQNIQTPMITRLLYGGITEEILIRFGVMSLIAYILVKITKKVTKRVYWFAIVFSSIFFAIGHFPIVFSTVDNPTSLWLLYILIGNTLGGIVFGWLYWKKGLEASIIAHMMAHIIMFTVLFIID